MERFACGYCGTSAMVQRRGGTIELKAVAHAIRNVQIGTDKTAAELVIVRLQNELNELHRRRKQLEEVHNEAIGCFGFACAVWIFILS
jgi:hypothetical protein